MRFSWPILVLLPSLSVVACPLSVSQTAQWGPRVPSLMPGVGQHHHPISTSNPLAQQFFDQGLALIFAFNQEEAVLSFQRAAELEPKSAMPIWGIALALGPNINVDM